MVRLTRQNTNSIAHRLAGDTLVAKCEACDHGEIVITDMIEERTGRCLECDATYELHLERSTT